MNKNDDKYIWGLFYFNQGDSRVIVPKMNKWMGWTFNFASPFTYIIIFAFVIILVLVNRFL